MLAATALDPLYGCETPLIYTPPLVDLTPETSRGFEAIWFAEEILGLELLPWQRWLFVHLLELREDGRFRFRSSLILIARQNGKSTFLQILSLYMMYVERVGLIIGTAQNLDVAEECWTGAVEMAEGVAELRAEISAVDRTNGKKALRLAGGSRYKVQAATRRGGRGLSGDVVLLDELREHRTWEAWGAVTKTTMARPNALILAASNAGDDTSVVLNDLREKALSDSGMAIFEWSAPEGCATDDRQAWAQANPALGYTITEASIESARATDPEWVFRTEVLCQRVRLGVDSPLPSWPSRHDPAAKPDPDWPLAFAVDVSWDRSTAWIGVAVRRPDGRYHLEVVAQGQGTEWVSTWLQDRLERWSPVAVCLQQTGAPASTLVEELTDALGTALVRPMSGPDMAKASGMLFDATNEATIVHPGQQQLDSAAAVAVVRPIGEAWAFDRKRSSVDVAPLVAVSQALWAIAGWKEPPKRTAPRRIR